MSKVTNAIVKLDDGHNIEADTFGNNIAIICPNCKSQPILLIARENQRGSSLHHAAICSSCRSGYYIISNLNADELHDVIIKEC
jgi:uncharacterized protein YbaR (Trm112 family)